MTKLQAVFDTLFQKGEEEGDEGAGEAAELDQGQPTPEDIRESRKRGPKAPRSGKPSQKGPEAGS
jgi:hypothetical protein